MSYYFNYYVGVIDKEGKIKPYGPYDANGKLHPILCRSRSFASHLYDDFNKIKDEQITDELRKEFEYEDYRGEKTCEVKYLPVKELPNGSYIKSGYFLIDDIKEWENSEDIIDFEGFYNMISPTIYAEKLRYEMQFGKNIPYENEDGIEVCDYNASDYMFYSIPDYSSKEYEADIIRQVCYMLDEYELPKEYKLVVLETEG